MGDFVLTENEGVLSMRTRVRCQWGQGLVVEENRIVSSGRIIKEAAKKKI